MKEIYIVTKTINGIRHVLHTDNRFYWNEWWTSSCSVKRYKTLYGALAKAKKCGNGCVVEIHKVETIQ